MSFFMQCIMADCDHIAVENPVGVMNKAYRKPDQIIEPYNFAESESDTANYVTKRTCLWLKGLPLLKTNSLNKPDNAKLFGTYKNGKAGCWNDSHARDPKVRSKTFPGIAKAFAEQWGDYLIQMDADAGTAEILQVNRDTMTDVPWLDVLGNYGGTEFKQLCLAYNYGDGGPKSCRNTVSAVSSLLFDAPIDYYMQVPMTAIPVLNDVVGGVPITFQEDMTDIDPAFVKGATVRLDGSQAEKFVRSRMGLSDDTNTYRMERQLQYLDSFQNCAREAIDTDSQFVLTLLEKLSDYLQTNLTGDQLVNFITQLDESEISPIRPPQGTLTLEDGHYAFYVDLDPTWEDVKRAYCG